jgi:molybdate transport system regulatory protein
MKPTLSVSPLDEKTRFRVQIKHAAAIGPGKADVLQSVAETGSLAEAGRRMGMSYQRVWSLVAAMNADFVEPLVFKQRGGVAGGGAHLTPTGERVLSIYRAIEHDAQRAVAKRLPQLLEFIRPEAGKPDLLKSKSGLSAMPGAKSLATNAR